MKEADFTRSLLSKSHYFTTSEGFWGIWGFIAGRSACLTAETFGRTRADWFVVDTTWRIRRTHQSLWNALEIKLTEYKTKGRSWCKAGQFDAINHWDIVYWNVRFLFFTISFAKQKQNFSPLGERTESWSDAGFYLCSREELAAATLLNVQFSQAAAFKLFFHFITLGNVLRDGPACLFTQLQAWETAILARVRHLHTTCVHNASGHTQTDQSQSTKSLRDETSMAKTANQI